MALRYALALIFITSFLGVSIAQVGRAQDSAVSTGKKEKKKQDEEKAHTAPKAPKKTTALDSKIERASEKSDENLRRLFAILPIYRDRGQRLVRSSNGCPGWQS